MNLVARVPLVPAARRRHLFPSRPGEWGSGLLTGVIAPQRDPRLQVQLIQSRSGSLPQTPSCPPPPWQRRHLRHLPLSNERNPPPQWIFPLCYSLSSSSLARSGGILVLSVPRTHKCKNNWTGIPGLGIPHLRVVPIPIFCT